MTTEIGIIKYINSIPFWYTNQSEYKYHFSSPSDLSNTFFKSNRSASLVSSHFYLSEKISPSQLLPFCISSKVNTMSTYLVYPKHTTLCDIKTIQLHSDSLTTNQLLRICCNQFFNINPRFTHTDSICTNKPFLCIGDHALKLDLSKQNHIDLSNTWYQNTGYPLCFGVWIKKKHYDSTHLEKIISDNIDQFFNTINTQIDKLSPQMNLHRDVLYDYFQGLSYRIDEKHILSMKLYEELLSNCYD